MLTSTLGGLIKDFRLKKRLSQLEVSLHIGWKDTTRLSKIEQGRVGKPTRPTIDKIMNALNLTELERGQMLAAASIAPSAEEVAIIVHKVKSFFEDSLYPVMLRDVTWNTYYLNAAARDLYKLSKEEADFIEKNKLNWMELQYVKKAFDRIKMNGGITRSKVIDIDEHIIKLFKYEFSTSSNERWYRELLSKVNKDPNFMKLWSSVEAYNENEHLLYNYESITFEDKLKKVKKLAFDLFWVYLTIDMRFYVGIHQPATLGTFTLYK